MDKETEQSLLEMQRQLLLAQQKNIELQQRIERSIETTNQLIKQQQPVLEQINRNLATTGEAAVTHTDHTFDALNAALSILRKIEFQTDVTASNTNTITHWRWGGY